MIADGDNGPGWIPHRSRPELERSLVPGSFAGSLAPSGHPARVIPRRTRFVAANPGWRDARLARAPNPRRPNRVRGFDSVAPIRYASAVQYSPVGQG
jgi:hypothetical protein